MEKELGVYRKLNDLATEGGLVILGGGEDRNIPLCELKQAFDLQEKLYNRSFAGLSVCNGADIFDNYVAPLQPGDILLHIGEADREAFAACPAEFDRMLSALLRHMKSGNEKCRIAVVSLEDAAEMNKHMAAVAQSEGCEFCDIRQNRVWDPKLTKDVLSFIYSTGFVRPLNRKRPLYDLARIMFFYA